MPIRTGLLDQSWYPKYGVVGKELGNYRIVSPLGKGGMASVYVGEHKVLGNKVAIKLLHPKHLENESIERRFFNEARAIATIRHSSVVEIFDFGRMSDGRAYIIMELLQGETLRTRIRKGIMPERHAAIFTRQVASGLEQAHKRGIVHRDLKPDNIFLVRDPEVVLNERAKVLDFGIAKQTAFAGVSSEHTATGILVGTPAYMSPEQCKGTGEVDARSDVYSLGVVLYRMVTNQLPFEAAGTGELIGKHLYVAPKRPSEMNPLLSDEMTSIVLRCLEKDPEQRYQSMANLAAALKRVPGVGRAVSHRWARDVDAAINEAVTEENTPPPTPIPNPVSQPGLLAARPEQSFTRARPAGGAITSLPTRAVTAERQHVAPVPRAEETSVLPTSITPSGTPAELEFPRTIVEAEDTSVVTLTQTPTGTPAPGFLPDFERAFEGIQQRDELFADEETVALTHNHKPSEEPVSTSVSTYPDAQAATVAAGPPVRSLTDALESLEPGRAVRPLQLDDEPAEDTILVPSLDPVGYLPPVAPLAPPPQSTMRAAVGQAAPVAARRSTESRGRTLVLVASAIMAFTTIVFVVTIRGVKNSEIRPIRPQSKPGIAPPVAIDAAPAVAPKASPSPKDESEFEPESKGQEQPEETAVPKRPVRRLKAREPARKPGPVKNAPKTKKRESKDDPFKTKAVF